MAPAEVSEAPPDWRRLPLEIVQVLARRLGGDGAGYPAAKTLLRLCCKDWRAALPMGHCLPANLWDWDDVAVQSLAPQVRDLRVLSPQGALPSPGPSSPLLHLSDCPRLRRLTLCHVSPAALGAGGPIASLDQLTALQLTVFWPMATCGWLDFAASLTNLQELSVAAAVIRLQPEGGLTALRPLCSSLRRLRLEDCVLAADVAAASLAQLGTLSALCLAPSAMGQTGIDRLGEALTRLQQLRIRVQDGVDPRVLLGLPGLTAVTLHMSRIKADSFIGIAGQIMPQARRLAVVLGGGPSGFLMSAPFQGAGLQGLEALSLEGVQLAADGVAHLAQFTALRELTAELDWTVRSGAFHAWGALRLLRVLSLRCNFYLRDEDTQGLLAGLPHLESVRLESLHGSGAALLPLRSATALTRLHLASCHFDSGALLGEALAGVVLPGDGASAGAPGLLSLLLDGCGVQSAVVSALTHTLGSPVPAGAPPLDPASADAGAGGSASASASGAAAVGQEGAGAASQGAVPPREESQGSARPVPVLRELKVELKWRVGNEAALTLAAAVASCSQLTSLDLHFPALSEPQHPVPAWSQLSALTALRSLHVCSGLGWEPLALARVCARCPMLRELAITDNQGVVGDAWVAALSPLRQLSRLELNSCRGLSVAGAVPALAQLQSLTSLVTYRCSGITSVPVLEELREALPCLARVSMRE